MIRDLTLGALVPEAGTVEAALPVAGLEADSRRVRPGFAFVAVPGATVDGAAFIDKAVEAGAAAVIGEGPRPDGLDPALAYVRVVDARRTLALAAARLHPEQPDAVVAVTGTSGKSSVADFTRQILAALGFRSASLGTLGVVTAEGASYGSLTTPGPLQLHALLADLARQEVTHLAMEASSHGLEQRRLDGVRLKAAAFTNLGRDHLDYHPSVENYLAAKLRLFDTLVQPGQPAVVNADGAEAERVIAACRARGLDLLTTGRAGEALRLVASRPEGFAQRLTLTAQPKRGLALEATVDLPLVGGFQVENALVAAGLVVAVEGDEAASAALAALASLQGVPGRLERVGEIDGALCIVDYAHKPEALAHVLDALRPFATGRLVCVFGCGGDRDRGKRPLMGRIAVERADHVIVTDDNPRSEEPAAIRAAILEGAVGAAEIGDRREAIRATIRGLQPGDVLVVAGKGHETGQIVGDRTYAFSDQDEIRAAIAERTG